MYGLLWRARVYARLTFESLPSMCTRTTHVPDTCSMYAKRWPRSAKEMFGHISLSLDNNYRLARN